MVRRTLWISCEARLNEAGRRGHAPLAPRLLHPLVGQPRGPTTACSVMGGAPYRGNLGESVPPTTRRLATHSGIVRPFSSRSKRVLTHPEAARASALGCGRGPNRRVGDATELRAYTPRFADTARARDLTRRHQQRDKRDTCIGRVCPTLGISCETRLNDARSDGPASFKILWFRQLHALVRRPVIASSPPPRSSWPMGRS
jgi:hypothetical protein